MGHTVNLQPLLRSDFMKLQTNFVLPSLIGKDVAEDGGVAEEGVDLEGVGHVEGEERHEDAARRHQHSQASWLR